MRLQSCRKLCTDGLLPFRAYCVGDLQKIDDVSRLLSVCPSVTLIIGYRSSDIKIGRRCGKYSDRGHRYSDTLFISGKHGHHRYSDTLFIFDTLFDSLKWRSSILCSRYSAPDTLPDTLFTILCSWILRSRYSAPNTYPNGLQLFTYKVERFTGWISSYFSVPVKGDSEAITTRSKFLETKRVDFRFGKCSIARGNWDRSDWQVPRCYWLKNLL